MIGKSTKITKSSGKALLVYVHYCNARNATRDVMRDARYTTERFFACYLRVKMTTRTINGTYVHNDTADITRHRKRHIFASAMETVGSRGTRRE